MSTPDVEPIVATPGVPLVHIPPVTELVSVIELPTHNLIPGVPSEPARGPGIGFTVTLYVAKQPVGIIYVIVTTPAATPVTTPVEDPTVAIVVLLLVHVPPSGLPVSVIEEPAHTVLGPEITGVGSTVMIKVAKQPVDNV